ncbi:MAG: hypothetical protein ACOCRO_03280 [Halanaerobiales bacterium]
MNYQELINRIKEDFPDKAIDIIESLELLRLVINETVEEIGIKINDAFTSKQYDTISYYTNMAGSIEFYENKIEEIISIDVEKVMTEEETDEEYEVKTIPNYSEYTVDNKIEHTLYENFTHKRPFGFKLNNMDFIEVKTWQGMLIKVCEHLIKMDENKFMTFENKVSMIGKKNKYFSTNPNALRKPKNILNKIYVEINQSGNAIRNLIIKLLKEYKFSISDFKVYFRADYTSLKS